MTITGRTARAGRLDVVLAATFPDLSRSAAATAVKEGRVLLNGRPATRVSLQVDADLHVDIAPAAGPADLPVARDLPLTLVYVDDHLAVVDKPAGLVVHPAPGHWDDTLVHALMFHLPTLSAVGGAQRAGIVHRLDKGTSGLIVVARNDLSHRCLAAQFADHSAGRIYLALVHGTPSADGGILDRPLGRHPVDRLRQAVRDDGRRAITHWRVRSRGVGASLVECTLQTGRTHQVRVHLASMGHPLLGDGLYARGRTPPKTVAPTLQPDGERPMLHALHLHFAHPSGGRAMAFTSRPPADFATTARAADCSASELEEAEPTPTGPSRPLL